MATDSIVVDPVEIWAESPESDTIARKPGWSDWTPVRGGWMRRRPRVPGLNGHWGKWYLNRSYNQHFRFNPASNGTHIETATEEIQFFYDVRNPVSITSQDYDAERTSDAESLHGVSEQDIMKTRDQGSAMIDEADDSIVFDPYKTAADIRRSDMGAEHGERFSEESTAALSEVNPKHRTRSGFHRFKSSQHRTFSAMASRKSVSASFSVGSAASVASASDHAVTTSSSATETTTTVATWIFGTIMAGVGVGTMRATQ